MNVGSALEITLAALAAEGVLTIDAAERISRDIKVHYTGWSLDDIKLRDVYEYLRPISDAYHSEESPNG